MVVQKWNCINCGFEFEDGAPVPAIPTQIVRCPRCETITEILDDGRCRLFVRRNPEVGESEGDY